MYYVASFYIKEGGEDVGVSKINPCMFIKA